MRLQIKVRFEINFECNLAVIKFFAYIFIFRFQVDEKGTIIDAKFKTFGCGSAIASSSLATEWIKGKNIDFASKVKNDEIAKELSLPPVKLHCSSKFSMNFSIDIEIFSVSSGCDSSSVEGLPEKAEEPRGQCNPGQLIPLSQA
jgi:hypothetical protein